MKIKSAWKWIVVLLVVGVVVAYWALHFFSEPKIVKKFSDGPGGKAVERAD